MRVKGDVALVTGAGKGIGRAIALTLAREGAKVAINYHTSVAEGLSVVEEIRQAGGEAVGIQADVAVASEVNRLSQETLAAFGKIDILVNNAGIFPRHNFLEMAEEDWDNMLRVNLKSVFLCCQAVGRIMRTMGGGRIVSISSNAAIRGAVKGVHYAASKAGIMALTKSLAQELAAYRIRVNCCAPGIVDTEMPRLSLTEEEIEERRRTLPTGRIGTPQDVANAVLFLASEESSQITGAIIYVNGGDIMP